METTILTNHAKDRLEERCGLKNSSKQRIADIAYNNGISHAETNGALRKAIDAIYLRSKTQHKHNVELKIYGRQIYIFSVPDKTLITVLPLGKEYYKAVDKIMKRKKETNYE